MQFIFRIVVNVGDAVPNAFNQINKFLPILFAANSNVHDAIVASAISNVYASINTAQCITLNVI